MASEGALIDTGPLVALLRKDDPSHAVCVEAARLLWRPMYTCWPVLTEVAWLLRGTPAAIDQLFKDIELGTIRPLNIDESAGPWLRAFFAKYRDLRPQLADACLCYLAERENIRTIFTLDRRDFSVIVDRHGKAFHLVPETLPS